MSKAVQFELTPIESTHDSSESLKTPAAIGRSADADVRLTDIWVSRRHCEFDEADGELIIRDLNSTHGTLVNGAPVIEKIIHQGDEISIGLTRFTVSWIGMPSRNRRRKTNHSPLPRLQADAV